MQWVANGPNMQKANSISVERAVVNDDLASGGLESMVESRQHDGAWSITALR
jgi:hypothetical protein